MDFKKKNIILNEKKNDLIYMIAGLTDPILKEQRKEEYDLLESLIDNNNKKNMNNIINNMVISYINFHREQFNNTNNFILALSLTNDIDFKLLYDKIKKNRLRIPKNCLEIEKFMYLSQVLNYCFIFKNLSGIIINKIGKGVSVNIYQWNNLQFAVPKWKIY